MLLEPVRTQLQPRDPSSCLSPGLGLFLPPLPPDSLLSPLGKSPLEGNGQCPSSEKENSLWSTSPSVRVPLCPLPCVTKLYGKGISTSYLCLLMTHPRTFQFGFCLQHHKIVLTGSYHFSKSIWLFFLFLRLFRFSAAFDTGVLSVFLKTFSSPRFYEPFYLGNRSYEAFLASPY